jgi:hypothetical protein
MPVALTNVPAGHGEQMASKDLVVPAQDPAKRRHGNQQHHSTYRSIIALFAENSNVMGVDETSGYCRQYVNNGAFNWAPFCARWVHEAFNNDPSVTSSSFEDCVRWGLDRALQNLVKYAVSLQVHVCLCL